MRSVIIGAGGFIGSRLAEIMLAEVEGLRELVLVDQVPFERPNDPRVCAHIGNFADPKLMRESLGHADSVVLLAAVLGGSAEANYPLSRRVNIDAALTLFEYLRDTNRETRMVFASTIAVYGKPLPSLVTDDTPTAPSMIYGAQKLMMEIALSNFAVRGWLDGVSLRPSGVMARDGADARLKSAFMSRVFYAVKRGEDIVLPVSPQSRTWLSSIETVARNFMHGVLLPAERFDAKRAFNLPALSLTFEELVQALYRRFPESRSKVTFEPEAEAVSLFGSYPELETGVADRLGFLRDLNADDLVAKSFLLAR